MRTLGDCEMDRLSNLLAQGNMDNADEIATLLKVELGEQSETVRSENLQSYFYLLGKITNQP